MARPPRVPSRRRVRLRREAAAGGSAPINTALPVISGDPIVGGTLTTTTGTWTGSPTSYAYQWKANGMAIEGATNPAFTLTVDQVGAAITVTVTANNGATASVTSDPVGPVENGDTTAPTITSASAISLAENTALSHTLTADEPVTWAKTGGADAALFTLTGATLTLPAQDYENPVHPNNQLVVQVTATDAAGNSTPQTITVTVTNVAEATLNPADKDSGIALSNGDLTATRTGIDQWASVRSTNSKTSGRHYYEAVFSEFSGGGNAAGFCNATQAKNGYVGNGIHGISVQQNLSQAGFIFKGGAGTAAIGTINKGDVIGAEADIDNRQFRCRNVTQNGAWSAYSAFPSGMASGAVFAGVSVFNAPTDSITVNFGATAFVGEVPAGAAAWGL